jgi:hypothetical protein
MADLPTNLDATFVDDPDNPGRKQHQQHHDSVHAGINALLHAHAAAVAAGFVGDLETWLKTLDDVLDHGALTGLADNDHPQYLLATNNLAALTDKAAARENLGANAAYVAKADQVWQRLAEVRLAANGAITFTSIPATFRHLRLVVAGRSTNATADDGVFLRFNGDATAVYDWQTMRASGTAVTAVEGIGQTYLDVGRIPAGNAPAGIVGSLVIDLPDYAQTATQKTALSNNVNKRDAVTGGLDARQHAGTWRNTAALSQVQIAAVSGQLLSNTVATLYGTKGA